MKAYSEAMEHIHITADMRQRVLEGIDAVYPTAKSKFLSFPGKTLAALAACLAIIVAAILAVPAQQDPAPLLELAPGEIVEAASAEELGNLVGFSIQEPAGLPFLVESTVYAAFWGDMAQIEYTGQGQTACYRKSPGEEDNSGQYGEFSATEELSVEGISVVLKGGGSGYTLAVWSLEGYAYSLSLSEPVEVPAWTELLQTTLRAAGG